jgi:hypothetical protein
VSDQDEIASNCADPLPTLAKLIELLTRRLQSGEKVDADEFVELYPARAHSIRMLLPTLFDLAELRRSGPRDSTTRRP